SKKYLPVALPVKATEAHGQDALFIFFQADSIPYLLINDFVLKLSSDSGAFEKFCSVSKGNGKTAFPEIIMNHYLFVAESNTFIYEVDLYNGVVKKFNLSD